MSLHVASAELYKLLYSQFDFQYNYDNNYYAQLGPRVFYDYSNLFY